jgi:hypothetical protein
MIGDRARVSVAVAVAPAQAFDIFTAQIDQWWRRGLKFRHSESRSGLLRIEPHAGGRLFESFDRDGTAHVMWRNANFAANEQTDVEVEFAPTASGTLVTVTHSGLSALRTDHPARHGLQGADFTRMIGLWWGEQMTSLRLLCAAARS